MVRRTHYADVEILERVSPEADRRSRSRSTDSLRWPENYRSPSIEDEVLDLEAERTMVGKATVTSNTYLRVSRIEPDCDSPMLSECHF